MDICNKSICNPTLLTVRHCSTPPRHLSKQPVGRMIEQLQLPGHLSSSSGSFYVRCMQPINNLLDILQRIARS